MYCHCVFESEMFPPLPDSDDSHCGEFASAEQSFCSVASAATTEAGDDLVTASTSLENVEVSQGFQLQYMADFVVVEKLPLNTYVLHYVLRASGPSC